MHWFATCSWGYSFPEGKVDSIFHGRVKFVSKNLMGHIFTMEQKFRKLFGWTLPGGTRHFWKVLRHMYVASWKSYITFENVRLELLGCSESPGPHSSPATYRTGNQRNWSALQHSFCSPAKNFRLSNGFILLKKIDYGMYHVWRSRYLISDI